MKKIIRHKLIIYVALMILFTSCSEDLLKEETPHIITTESLYSSFSGFEAGLNGLYSLVRTEREGTTSPDNHPPADMFMNGTDRKSVV